MTKVEKLLFWSLIFVILGGLFMVLQVEGEQPVPAFLYGVATGFLILAASGNIR